MKNSISASLLFIVVGEGANNSIKNKKMKCESCNKENYLQLVRYQSFFFKCPFCKNNGSATTFAALKDFFIGEFEIIEVDQDLNQLRIFGKGTIEDFRAVISAEAGKGKTIWLKEIN
ncbi:MAG TPA: hypothetical protein VKT28_08090 [Puia sp.]|nr:hypothetical protein [Puia sp.]